jgi:hypothetical protein
MEARGIKVYLSILTVESGGFVDEILTGVVLFALFPVDSVKQNVRSSQSSSTLLHATKRLRSLKKP